MSGGGPWISWATWARSKAIPSLEAFAGLAAIISLLYLPASWPLNRKGNFMLFHITQVHAPESCPLDEGGSNSLFDPNVPGIKLIGRYGANAQHTLFLIVESDDVNTLHKFLLPGFKRCTSTITPVSEVPVPKE